MSGITSGDVQTVINRLGTNTETATDPSAATGTVFSKNRGEGDNLDTILARIPAAGTISAVKSRGRGTILIASGVTDNTATITAVVTANTKVWLLGWEMAVITAVTGVMPPRIELTNTTTITASRSDNGSAPLEHITVGYEYEELY